MTAQDLPILLPLVEAARKYGLEETRLRRLIEEGKIRAGSIAGEMVVSEKEVREEATQARGSHILPALLPLAEAARKYGLEESRLRSLIEEGKIRAGNIAGETVVSEEEVREEAIKQKGLGKEDLPEYKKHAHLRGNPIWISEAARKYGILQPTLSKWVKAGYIKQLGLNGNKVLIDEADVAYCAEIYRQSGRMGRILFNSDGTPYKRKIRAFAS